MHHLIIITATFHSMIHVVDGIMGNELDSFHV
jgi:hypothetical protein